jgi:hypothetical protein
MHLKVFLKLKKTLKPLSSGQKKTKNPNPKKNQKTTKNSKKPKHPKKNKKKKQNPTGLVIFFLTGFFPILPSWP